MARLVYAFPTALSTPEAQMFPGMARYSHVFKLYGGWVMPVDRTGHITIPVKNISHLSMPADRAFSKTYEEICNDRATELLKKADALDIGINVMYSGGIDSTCLLVSLLKQATAEQKKRITVLLSHESIAENPRFYEEYIKKNLRVGSSITFPELIGGNDMLLSAEHNDLVMGNASVSSMITRYGFETVHKSYTREFLVDFFEGTLNDHDAAVFYFELFDRLNKTAPIEISSNFDFMWWYNFATKWQACFCYILFYTLPENTHKITKEYLDTRFISFYNTDEFQLWSMNNLDKRIKDTWKSYKWVMKDIIYNFNKDAEYRDNRTKVRSLPIVMKQHPIHFPLLDEEFRFRNDLKPKDFLLPENDFA